MAYTRARNPRLDARFDSLATYYMRHGEQLSIRWDVAFFQMMLETGSLRFGGDVRPDQNNFAGLGASGGGARGERFDDISTGVKAHLQHLLMYAGEHVDAPVAERTRKVQEWGVLTKWQQSIKGPMTYSLVAKQWAPSSRNYVRDVAAITDGFYSEFCNGPDPRPELVQEARQGRTPPSANVQTAAASTPADTAPPAATATPGEEIANRRIEEERKENPPLRALGASMLGSVGASNKTAEAAPPEAPSVTILNGSSASAEAPASAEKTKSPPASKAKAKTAENAGQVQTASIGTAATHLKVPSAKTEPSTQKCKVFTASYGGQKAVIIKAAGSDTINYTVLDVTEANEKREVDAYIAAYAKGGERVGSFPTQTKALHKAFELCPEG